MCLQALVCFLVTGGYDFEDAAARSFCQALGCYDNANHAAHLKDYKGAEFTGEKNKGYAITKPGIKKGAALVKELASQAK